MVARKGNAAAAAKAPPPGSHSVGDAVHQIAKTKTSAETLAAIADLYTRFLTLDDTRTVVRSLDTLVQERVLESHVWRVCDAALNAKTTPAPTRHAWLQVVLVLVSHRIRRADHAKDLREAWSFIGEDVAAWRAFVATLTTAPRREWTLREKAALVQFLVCCFASLDVDAVAAECVKLVSLAMWATALSPSQRAIEFAEHPKLARHWKKLKLEDASNAKQETETATPAKKKRKTEASPKQAVTDAAPLVSDQETAFVTGLLQDVLAVLMKTDVTQLKTTDTGDDHLRYIALMLTLLTDLLSSLPTRRFLEAVLRRKHVLAMLAHSPLVQWFFESRTAVEISALTKQIERLEHAMHFPIDPHTGKSLTTLQDRKEASTRKIQAMQLAAFDGAFRDTPVGALAVIPVSAVVDRAQFREQIEAVAQADRHGLEQLALTIGMFAGKHESSALSISMLADCFINEYSVSFPPAGSNRTQLPTELDIWSDSSVVESQDDDASPIYGTGPGVLFPVLPIAKLSLQYLTLSDLLERATELSQAEAANAVRRDLEEAIRPLDAVRSVARNGETIFRGFSPMAVPLQTAFSVMKVENPRIGESSPAAVIAQFDIELDTRHDIAAFDRFQRHEVVYLVTIRPARDEASEAIGFDDESADHSGHFAEDYGVLYVRCAELIAIEDESGQEIKHSDEDDAAGGKGRKRTINVKIDGAQYKRDLEHEQLGAYEYVNLLVRRDPRTNNFKAVHDAMSITLQNSSREKPGAVVPSWLYDLYLGYGEQNSASFEAIAKGRLQASVVASLHDGFGFGDAARVAHLCSLERNHDIRVVDADNGAEPLACEDATGPYTLLTDIASKTSVLKAHGKSANSQPATETCALTQEQARAVIRGTTEGLTLVVGASRTGKSEAVVHLIQNLYQGHQTADEKIMVVARSSSVLDKLLDRLKTMPFVDEGSIARLGARRNDGGDDFSCQGRVKFMLQRRIYMLQEVDAMAKWIERVDSAKYSGISSSASYSCENALFFYRFYLKALLDDVKQVKTVDDALLSQYFKERNGAQPSTVAELQDFACRLEGVYGELHRLQPFELLQMPAQRRDVYLMQHARVIATTSRHCSLQFQKLIALKLKWTSVIFEDAAQLSETDSVIPLALACRSNSFHKHQLKRLVMVGDDTQHAAVDIPSLKSYSRLQSSLFSRFLRLGVPHVALTALPAAQSKKSKPAPPPKKNSSKK